MENKNVDIHDFVAKYRSIPYALAPNIFHTG